MNSYDVLINQSIKILRVIYVLVIVLTIKTTLEVLFMVAIPQMTHSVTMHRDAKEKITSKDETTQRTIPLLHRFFNT